MPRVNNTRSRAPRSPDPGGQDAGCLCPCLMTESCSSTVSGCLQVWRLHSFGPALDAFLNSAYDGRASYSHEGSGQKCRLAIIALRILINT